MEFIVWHIVGTEKLSSYCIVCTSILYILREIKLLICETTHSTGNYSQGLMRSAIGKRSNQQKLNVILLAWP